MPIMSTVNNFSNEFAYSQSLRRKDSFDVIAGAAKDEFFTIAKAVKVGIDCLEEAGQIPEDKKEIYANIGRHANLVKLSKFPGTAFKYVNTLRHSAVGFIKNPTIWGAADTFRQGNNCISPVWDGMDFINDAIMKISKKTMQLAKGISGSSLVLAMGWNACETFKDIANCDLSKVTGKERNEMYTKISKSLIKLAKEVSYIALGVFIVLSVFFDIVAAPVVFTALSASTVVWTLLGYYVNHIGEPIPATV